MTDPKPDSDAENGERPRLRALRVRVGLLGWACAGTIISVIGLVMLTGLASTPWLFLLYPVLIAVLLTSLGAIGLHLIHRF